MPTSTSFNLTSCPTGRQAAGIETDEQRLSHLGKLSERPHHETIGSRVPNPEQFFAALDTRGAGSLASATNGPTLRWYVEHVRPMVDTGKSDALFLNLDGKRWTHRAFGKEINAVGKQVWPRFYGYCTRHWFATHFLIANDVNLKATAERLGDTTAVVETYHLDEATVRAEMESRYAMPRIRPGGR